MGKVTTTTNGGHALDLTVKRSTTSSPTPPAADSPHPPRLSIPDPIDGGISAVTSLPPTPSDAQIPFPVMWSDDSATTKTESDRITTTASTAIDAGSTVNEQRVTPLTSGGISSDEEDEEELEQANDLRVKSRPSVSTGPSVPSFPSHLQPPVTSSMTLPNAALGGPVFPPPNFNPAMLAFLPQFVAAQAAAAAAAVSASSGSSPVVPGGMMFASHHNARFPQFGVGGLPGSSTPPLPPLMPFSVAAQSTSSNNPRRKRKRNNPTSLSTSDIDCSPIPLVSASGRRSASLTSPFGGGLRGLDQQQFTCGSIDSSTESYLRGTAYGNGVGFLPTTGPSSTSYFALDRPSSSEPLELHNHRRLSGADDDSDDNNSSDRGGCGDSGSMNGSMMSRDTAYVERRRKNNEAAKRSRDARRMKERETAYRAAALEQENVQLKAELTVLRAQAAKLHRLLYNKLGI